MLTRLAWGSASVVAVAVLTGCGSDGGGSQPSDSASTTSSIATTAAAPSTSSAATPAATTPAATSSAATASAGPAAAGKKIKAGAPGNLPTTVGSWTTSKAASGPAAIYSRDGNLISVSFLSGSDYDSIVKNVTQQRTRAGTGYCGSTSEPTNLTCYLETVDGVINASADSGDVPLAELVAFVNRLTALAGTT